MSLEGEIGEIDLIEKLVSLGREHFTGAIRFENDGIIKIVYFKTGDILSASTNDRADSIDEILLRAGKVTREHVKQALAKRKESETLGDALLGLGFITRKELTWARRAQAIGILRSLRGWTVGQYTIVEDYLPKREEGTLFPLPQMLVELIVTETDRARFDHATDGGSAVFHKATDFDDAFRRLGLNQDAEDIAGHIDGSNTAADVAAASGKDAFNVYKLLEALRVLGLLTKAEGTPQVPADTQHDFASVGVADAADAWHSDAKFDLDDEPAVTLAPTLPATPEEKLPAFDWDQPAHSVAPGAVRSQAHPAEAPSATMPSWDEPAPAATREIPAVNVAPPPDRAPEPDWGFDDAQIETARRASVPLYAEGNEGEPEPMVESVKKAAKPNRWVGALLGSVLIVILAAAGWFGYGWWQARNAPPEPVLTARANRPRRPLPTPGTTTAPLTGTSGGLQTTTPTGSMGVLTGTNVPAMPVPPSGPSVTPVTTSNQPPTSAGGIPARPAPSSVAANSTTAHQGSGLAPAPTTSTTTSAAPATTRPVPTPASAPSHPLVVGATTTAPHPSKPPVPVSSKPPAPAPSSAGVAHLERPAGGNAMITNAGGSNAAGSIPAGSKDAQRARYDAMAREHASNAKGAYTLQFELVCETASLSKAIAAGEKVWFTPLTYRGRSCYRVYWGNYATAGEAEQAKGEIPASLRESAPVVVRVPKQP
jgi:hypothetical protein